MKNIHDLIVIGAGLSSLMFLSQYIKKSTNQSILLLEQKNSIKQDQTFCVWEGPGLHNITDQFHLKPKKIWSKVALNEAGTEIKRHINPYKYVCFDGGETLKKLTEACAPKVTTISNEKVDRIIHRNGTHEITTTNGT
jgi:lycopene beta-cyclase